MSSYYIEFVGVQRHVLQVEADSPDDVLEACREVVSDGSCAGLQVLDSDQIYLLVHEFGSDEEGPVMYANSPFSDNREWMTLTASTLLNLKDSEETVAQD